MRQHFARDIRSLDSIFAFLHRFSAEERLDARASYALDLAVEEFFTNLVKYGHGEGNDVLLEASRTGRVVTVRMEERTSAPFDVTRATDAQAGVPVGERRPGGLGIQIAREMLDGLAYDYAEGTSRITLTKHLEK